MEFKGLTDEEVKKSRREYGTNSIEGSKGNTFFSLLLESLGDPIIKILLGVIIVGALLFIPAGTFDYWNGWLFMGLMFIPMFLLELIFHFVQFKTFDIFSLICPPCFHWLHYSTQRKKSKYTFASIFIFLILSRRHKTGKGRPYA